MKPGRAVKPLQPFPSAGIPPSGIKKPVKGGFTQSILNLRFDLRQCASRAARAPGFEVRCERMFSRCRFSACFCRSR